MPPYFSAVRPKDVSLDLNSVSGSTRNAFRPTEMVFRPTEMTFRRERDNKLNGRNAKITERTAEVRGRNSKAGERTAKVGGRSTRMIKLVGDA